jgi:LmbE family N-acetylglucosaminyl deacetylase
VTRTILVIAAHPDDEVLGCGGTAARLAGEGHRVYLAIFGEGITSRYQDRNEADKSLLDALHNKSAQVARLLRAQDLFMYGLPDNRFDTVPLLDVIKIVEPLITRLRPDTVFTHHPADLNVDHVVLHRAVMTATRPTQGHPVKEVYAFEIASSSEWSFGQFDPVFRPNVFFDVAGTLQTKIDAMQLYESEARPFPHPRSPDALRAIARHWGSAVGVEAAEAFALVRSVR